MDTPVRVATNPTNARQPLTRAFVTAAVLLTAPSLVLVSSAYEVWWWHDVAYVPLLMHQVLATRRQRMVAAVVFPIVFLATYGRWLVAAIAYYGELPTTVSLGLFALLVVATALPMMPLYASPKWMRAHLGPWWTVFFAAAFVVTEFAVDALALFPTTLAASQLPVGPVRQWVAIGGTSAVTAIVVGTNAVVAEAILRRREARSVAGLVTTLGVMWGFVLGVGWQRQVRIAGLIAEAPTHRVGIIQTDFDGKKKEREPLGAELHYAEHSVQLLERGVDLLVWPEAAAAGRPGRPNDPLGPSRRFIEYSGQYDVDVIVGASSVRKTMGEALTDEEVQQTYNSASLFTGGAYTQIHDKALPMPFAEYLPLREWLPGPLRELGEAYTGWLSTDNTVTLLEGEMTYGVPICYEAFHASHARSFYGADLIVVIANDSWFGRTDAAEVAGSFAALRALESGRSVVRSGLTGVSMWVTPDGARHDRLAPFEMADRVYEVPVVTAVRTPFARWGEWSVVLASALLAGLLTYSVPRRHRVGGVRHAG